MSTVMMDEEALRALIRQMTRLQINATGIRTVMKAHEGTENAVMAMASLQADYALVQRQLEGVLDAVATA